MGIDELRERLEILEEENRQLKDDVGIIDALPDPRKIRLLGLSPTGFRLFVLLSKRKMVLRSSVIYYLWPDGDEPDTAMGTMSTQLHHIRKCLRQYGIEIKNMHGVGWYLEDDDRKKAGEIVSEIMK